MFEKTQEIQNEDEKQYIKIGDKYFEIVEGVEYVVSKEEAIEMGYDEELAELEASQVTQ